jgi:hypothetical protein
MTRESVLSIVSDACGNSAFGSPLCTSMRLGTAAGLDIYPHGLGLVASPFPRPGRQNSIHF